MNPRNAEINQLTKESIAYAAAELIKNHQKLSVTAICVRAGVSRNAFYRNFSVTEDTLIHYLILRWAAYAEAHDVDALPKEQAEHQLICFFYEEKEFIRVLKERDCLSIVEQVFTRVVIQQHAEGAMRYYLYAAAYLMYGFIRAMIDRDFADTPAEIEQMAKDFREAANHQSTID